MSTCLVGLGEELSATVAGVNEVAGAALGDPNTPLGAVTRILNSQLQALSQVEARVGELAADLGAISLASQQQQRR